MDEMDRWEGEGGSVGDRADAADPGVKRAAARRRGSGLAHEAFRWARRVRERVMAGLARVLTIARRASGRGQPSGA